MDHISIRMEEGLAPDDVQPPISGWVASIEDNLLKAEKAETPDAWAKVCIYRVPKALRDVNPHAFDPHTVSIGPYHRGKEGLRDMDIHKWRCLCKIIGRSERNKVFLFNSIREVVSEARSCYEGTIELSDDEFVETMVLDGCFLLEIFRGWPNDFESLGYSSYDPVFSFGRALDFIRQDIKRLENQVPLFILGRLLGLITNKMKDKKDEVIRLAFNYLRATTPYFDPLRRPLPEKYRNCVHCLDIYRQSLLDDEIRPIPPNSPPTEELTIPCVTKLRKAGIKVEKGETNCFLDIKFEAGVLRIPKLVLDDNIVRREFPNLIAFEQCHLRCNNHVTSYTAFMDELIDSSDDVAYLHDRGIIDPFGGGSYNETADFFNSIGNEVFFDSSDSYLSGVTMDLSKEVQRYHESITRNWTVKIKRRYFSYPWTIHAATFGLVLTFLATFYAMYGYYKPTS